MKDNSLEAPVLILGAGNIGTAMARGILASDRPVVVYNRSPKRLEQFKGFIDITCTTDLNAALESKPWLILVCVDTEGVAELLAAAAPKIAKYDPIVGSCAAVRTLEDMRKALKGVKNPKLLRVLPNIAAGCGKSVNLIASEGLSDDEIDAVLRALDCTGENCEVPERLFGPAMSLSSCGIAMAMRYVRAQTEAAVQLGLAPEVAAKIAGGTLAGAADLIRSGRHPEALIDTVTTPGGLTIRGLNAMEEAGFSRAVMAGIFASNK